MFKLFLTTFAILAGIYLLFGLFLFFRQSSFVYFPPDTDFENCQGFSDYQKKQHRGTRFYFKKRSPEKLLVHYHGNAESACNHSHQKDTYEAADHSLIFVEYAGYGEEGQRPSKSLVLKDAENIDDFIQQEGFEEVTVIGQSLGSGPASHQASLGSVNNLILITPFSTFADIAQRSFPLYPVSLLLKENYNNKKALIGYDAKLVIFHGDSDLVIPHRFSQALFNSLPVQNKQYFLIEGAGHESIWESEDFKKKLEEVIKN